MEVYLGCLIDNAYRNRVRQVLRAYSDKGFKVKLFQTTRSQKEFALETGELEI